MSYYFITNEENTKLLRELRTHYHNVYKSQNAFLKAGALHTPTAELRAKSLIKTCNTLYNMLTKIDEQQLIEPEELLTLKKLGGRNHLLMKLLNAGFNSQACIFKANPENTSRLSKLIKKYQFLYEMSQTAANKKRISPDYTQEEYLEELNTGLSYNSVYLALVNINRSRAISHDGIKRLKKSFSSFDDAQLLSLLDNAFTFPLPTMTQSPCPRVYTPGFGKAGAIQQRGSSPPGIENVGATSSIDSSLNQLPDMACRSPRLTPTQMGK